MKALLLLSVLITLTSPALARIGETREQCEARYGKPVEENKELSVTIYKKDGLTIACVLHEGKCEHIEYAISEDPGRGRPPSFSEAEKKVLMEANSNSGPWTRVEHDVQSGREVWASGSLSTLCRGNPTKYISISTLSYEDRNKATEGDAGKLKGF